MEDTQLKSMNGKYVEYFVFIRDTFLILNTLNNPQERKIHLTQINDGKCLHLFSVFGTFMSVVMQNICILSIYFHLLNPDEPEEV